MFSTTFHIFFPLKSINFALYKSRPLHDGQSARLDEWRHMCSPPMPAARFGCGDTSGGTVIWPWAVHDSLTNEFLSTSTNRFSRKLSRSIHNTHFYVVDYFSGHLHLIFYLFANFQNRVPSAAANGNGGRPAVPLITSKWLLYCTNRPGPLI